jgi:hypothetical protein
MAPQEGAKMPEVEQHEVSQLQLRLAEAEAQATTTDVVDLAELVDRAGPIGWLVEGLWPADAYGAIAAKDKAGKTWVATDLAVSVATGTPWLGRFTCEPGPVIAYAGEGGARNIVRRIRAVAEHKGVPFGSLGGRLFVSEVAPRFRNAKALEQMETEVRLHGPRLVIVDPLYLAAAGGKGSDLYAMGEVLSGPQRVCQENGAALVVTHHWNKTGTGTGVDRMTGVGPTAWGRVLGSGAVSSARMEDDRSTVEVEWEFVGSEISGCEFTMTRTVWAEDPSDLTSPLHYEVEVVTGIGRTLRIAERESGQRDGVLAFVVEHPALTTRAIERAFGRKVRGDLFGLRAEGKVNYVEGPRRSMLWTVTQ